MIYLLSKWLLAVILEVWNCISDITKSAYKSAVATTTGTGAGYIPEVVSNSQGNMMSSTDRIIQYLIWAVTLIVGIIAIINGIQQQMDRHKKQKQDEGN